MTDTTAGQSTMKTSLSISRPLLVLAVALGVLAGGAGTRADSPPAFETSRLAVVGAKGRFELSVEMAVSWEQRQLGLQWRQRLDADAGMLFDFQRPQPVVMWMKNTYLPLDMVFIAADGRIANIAAHTEPLSLAPIRSAGPVRAVLEVGAGTAARLGLRAGDRVIHPIFE